jgi:phage terminase Nu1 subunit (DNA packaging protein)
LKKTLPKAKLPDVSLGELSRLLTLTPRRIQLLESEGIITKSERGKYNLRTAIVGYITFLRDDNKNKTKTASASDLNRARAELVKVQVEERTKDLVDAARQEALSVAGEIIGEVKSGLMSIPARVTLDVPLRRKIEEEIERVLGAVAETSRRIAAGEDAGGDVSEAGEATAD